ARIEKALAGAPGVRQAGVNFATGRATVAYDPSATNPGTLRDVIRAEGYDALLPDSSSPRAADDQAASAADTEFGKLRLKLIVGAVLTVPVVTLAMAGHLIPTWEAALAFPARPWIELALTTPVVFWAGWDFLAGAWKAARHRAADMNTLIALGTLAAFLYSLA